MIHMLSFPESVTRALQLFDVLFRKAVQSLKEIINL